MVKSKKKNNKYDVSNKDNVDSQNLKDDKIADGKKKEEKIPELDETADVSKIETDIKDKIGKSDKTKKDDTIDDSKKYSEKTDLGNLQDSRNIPSDASEPTNIGMMDSVVNGVSDNNKPSSGSVAMDLNYTNNYDYSMEHFFSNKNELSGLYGRTFYVTDDQQFIYGQDIDIYKGKMFTDRVDFWKSRLELVVKIMMFKFKIPLKRETEDNQMFNTTVNDVVDQFREISYDGMYKLLDKSIAHRRTWRTLNDRFHNTYPDHIFKLPTVQVGNGAILKRREALLLWEQYFYTPEPLYYQYPISCLVDLFTAFNELAAYNISGNLFRLTMKQDKLKYKSTIAIRHQLPNPDPSDIFTEVASNVFDFKLMMFRRLASIISDMLIIKSSNVIVQTGQISSALNLVLTVVSKLNSTASNVFSTNAEEVFSTFVAGSCLPGMFKFTMDINIVGGFDIGVIIMILMYLIYVPNTLLDTATVFTFKTYLYEKLLGAFAWSDNRFALNFDPLNPTAVNNRQAIFNGQALFRQGQSLAGSAPDFTQYLTLARGNGDNITEFFEYNFAQRNARLNNNSLYDGIRGTDRFRIVLNLLYSVTAFPIHNSTLTTAAKNQIAGMIFVIRNQQVAYEDYVKYITNAVDIVMGLGLSNFRNNTPAYDLDLPADKFLALTVKLDSFTADFKSSMYHIYAWSNAVKFEVGFCLNWFRKLWDRKNIWVTFLSLRHKIADFLKPIADMLKYFMTTDIGKWVWDNYWKSMTKVDFGANPNIPLYWDLMLLDTTFDDILERVQIRELQCGYSSTLSYYVPSNTNSGRGLAYSLYGTVQDPVLPVHTRTSIMGLDNTLGPCYITDEYPAFRTIPESKSNNGSVDIYKCTEDLFAGNKSINIPHYYRYATSSETRPDQILLIQPLIKPMTTNFAEVNTTLFGTNENRFIYIQNDNDDIFYKSSSDLKNFMLETRMSI